MFQSDLLARTLAELIAGPYGSRLGIRVIDVVDGVARLEMPYAEQNTNRGRNLHGGAIASVLLCGGAVTAASTQRSNQGVCGRVLNAAVSYLSAVQESGLTVVGRCLRRGRDTAHVQVDACDERGRSVASALVIYRFEDGETASRVDGEPTVARAAREKLNRAVSRRMSGSPYGVASCIEVIDECSDGAAARIALEPNQGRPGAVHEGAIAGLVDNCGAISSYSCSGVGYDKPGATVGMYLVFCEGYAGALVGFSRLVARSGTAFTNQVEVWSPASEKLAAIATVSYRILAEERPRE